MPFHYNSQKEKPENVQSLVTPFTINFKWGMLNIVFKQKLSLGTMIPNLVFLRGELRILALWWHGGLKRWGYQTQYTNQRVPKKKRKRKVKWFPKVLDSKSKQTSPKKKRIRPSCPLSNTMMWRVLLRGRRWAIRDQGCWTYSPLFSLIFAYHHLTFHPWIIFIFVNWLIMNWKF